MDAIRNLKCLEAAGAIFTSQLDAYTKIIKDLPTSQADLLAIIAAATITNATGAGALLMAPPLDTESVTSTSTVDVKTLTIPSGATSAIVTVFTNNIIFRADGGAPAAAAGHFAAVGANFAISNLSDFKFISSVAGNAVIFVSYF